VLGWGCHPQLGDHAIASDGRHVWVVCDNGTVLALNAVTGTFVADLASPSLRYGLSVPGAVASDGRHVWVTNPGGDWVTELDAATGALVRVLKGNSYGSNDPDAIASDGTHVWVANNAISGASSVTELNAHTGTVVRVLNKPRYGLNTPIDVASDGRHVWV